MTPEELEELRFYAKRILFRSEQRARSCDGKFRFESFDVARKSIRHKEQSAYRCKYCGGWHVGDTSNKSDHRRHERLLRRQKQERRINNRRRYDDFQGE